MTGRSRRPPPAPGPVPTPATAPTRPTRWRCSPPTPTGRLASIPRHRAASSPPSAPRSPPSWPRSGSSRSAKRCRWPPTRSTSGCAEDISVADRARRGPASVGRRAGPWPRPHRAASSTAGRRRPVGDSRGGPGQRRRPGGRAATSPPRYGAQHHRRASAHELGPSAAAGGPGRELREPRARPRQRGPRLAPGPLRLTARACRRGRASRGRQQRSSGRHVGARSPGPGPWCRSLAW